MNTSQIPCILITAIFLVLAQGKILHAGTGPIDQSSSTSTDPVPPPNTQPPPGTANPISTTTFPSINQQADFIQNNSAGFSNLTYPNCQGACIFAIGRTNNRQTWEAVGGIVWQISSPENTQAKTNRLIVQSEREKLERESTVILIEKLADAIESGKSERANLLAIILAKRLGYSDPQQLLREARTK
jgi:hypothetical protein